MNGTLQVSAAEYQAVIQTLVRDAAYSALRDGVGLGCESASNFDPTLTFKINQLTRRSVSNPRAT